MAFNPPQGPRLPYVVRKLEGKVKRVQYRFNRRLGKIEPYEVEEDAGYLAMFPNGHYLRIRTKDDLIRFKINQRPKVINSDGLVLPESQVQVAFENMEANVAALVRKRSGPMAIPGYEGKLPIPTTQEVESYA